MENHLELTVAKKRAREELRACSENDSDCENIDVPALQHELAKLRKENQTLKKMLKQSYDDQPRAVALAPEMSAEEIKNSAERLLKSLATSIKSQMVYKPSLKRQLFTNLCLFEWMAPAILEGDHKKTKCLLI